MDLLLAALILFTAHGVKGVTGFGSALIAVPLLALLWGPAEAILVNAACDVCSGAFLAFRERKVIRWLLPLAMVPALLAGQYVGTELLVWLPEQTVRWTLATVVALFGASMVWRPVRPGQGELTALPHAKGRILAQASAAALAGGVMAGLTGAGGPPIVLFMKHHFHKKFFRAHLIGVFMLGAICLGTLLLLKGAADPMALTRVPILVPALVGGALVGGKLAPRLEPALFGRVVGVLLVGAGLAMLL